MKTKKKNKSQFPKTPKVTIEIRVSKTKGKNRNLFLQKVKKGNNNINNHLNI